MPIMGRRALGLLSAGCVGALLAGCSRTALTLGEEEISSEAGADAVLEDVATEVARVDGATDATVDVSVVDVAEDVRPLVCLLQSAGAPKTILSFADRHATAPSIVTLSAGSAGSPATIAYQAMGSGGSSALHSDIQIARVQVSDPWPTGAVIDRGPTLLGVESHGWAELAVAQPPSTDVAIGWHGDPENRGRPMFRALDPGTWSPRAIVDLAPRGEAVLALARGASISGDRHTGSGWAVAWRDVAEMQTFPRLLVLDARGVAVMPPIAAAFPSAYPGATPAIAWSGAHYLVAVAYGDCPPACLPFTLSVSRLLPPTTNGPPRLELRGTFAGPAARRTLFRPALSAFGADTFLAWGEGASREAPRDIRLARLDATGTPSADVTIAKDARAIGAVIVSASALGVVVAWPEEGDALLPSTTPGRHRLVVHHLDRTLTESSPPVEIPITRFDDYGRLSLAALDAGPGRGVLLAWGGAQPSDEGVNIHDVALLGRLVCAEP